MDAIYILTEEFPTLPEAWNALTGIAALVDPSPPRVQAFRFSFPRFEPPPEIAQPITGLWQQRGWLFHGHGNTAFLTELAAALSILTQARIPFRITSDQFHRAGGLELLSKGEVPTISIPLEDRVENTSRHLGKFIAPFARFLNARDTAVRAEFEAFYAHAVAHLAEEHPYSFAPKSVFPLFQKASTLRLIPKVGTVGRHRIFNQLWIQAFPEASTDLIPLYASLIGVGRIDAPRLYLQYFVEAGSGHRPSLAENRLLEATFDLIPRDFSFFAQLAPLLNEATDGFAVLEHERAHKLGGGSILYTLRKIPGRGYELRVNPSFLDEARTPEEWIDPVAQASGWDWNRIV